MQFTTPVRTVENYVPQSLVSVSGSDSLCDGVQEVVLVYRTPTTAMSLYPTDSFFFGVDPTSTTMTGNVRHPGHWPLYSVVRSRADLPPELQDVFTFEANDFGLRLRYTGTSRLVLPPNTEFSITWATNLWSLPIFTQLANTTNTMASFLVTATRGGEAAVSHIAAAKPNFFTCDAIQHARRWILMDRHHKLDLVVTISAADVLLPALAEDSRVANGVMFALRTGVTPLGVSTAEAPYNHIISQVPVPNVSWGDPIRLCVLRVPIQWYLEQCECSCV